jgi:hypothetical protein
MSTTAVLRLLGRAASESGTLRYGHWGQGRGHRRRRRSCCRSSQHRNKALGRRSTREDVEYLQVAGSFVCIRCRARSRDGFAPTRAEQNTCVTQSGHRASSRRNFPLVMLSHGTGGGAATLAWLAETLASNGYIVVAVNHHVRVHRFRNHSLRNLVEGLGPKKSRGNDCGRVDLTSLANRIWSSPLGADHAPHFRGIWSPR